MPEIFKRATDPTQYDDPELTWENETGLESPFRAYYYGFLSKYKQTWRNADILDIGCGTGWLLELFLKNGARSVQGIEPSKKNSLAAHRLRPHIQVFQRSLESFQTRKRFDLITAVMVFHHLADLSQAFKKTVSLLKPNGELQIIIADFDYLSRPRHNYELRIEKLNADEYAIQMTGTLLGTIAEIARKVEVYTNQAKKAGLKLVEHVPMYASPELLAAFPRYEESKHLVRSRFLRFQKPA